MMRPDCADVGPTAPGITVTPVRYINPALVGKKFVVPDRALKSPASQVFAVGATAPVPAPVPKQRVIIIPTPLPVAHEPATSPGMVMDLYSQMVPALIVNVVTYV